LGEGVATSGVLRVEAIGRTVAALGEYARVAGEHGASLTAVATEGMRLAENADAFLVPARETLGCPVRILSGEQEAELSFASVAREVPDERHLRVLDIGGGSTELVLGESGAIVDRRSHPMGSVRFTEQYVKHDPPLPPEVESMESAALSLLAQQPVEPHDVLYGLAGTVTSAAALLLGLEAYDRERVDGSRFALQAIVDLRDKLAAAPLAVREGFAVLGRGRADVIVAGVTILVATMKHCGASTLVVRDRGLRYALL
jgi:exopolyphosphatase/guanosine-5'-triphosphate,3'-diphosphate pyrophosphatase